VPIGGDKSARKSDRGCRIELARYRKIGFERGRSRAVEALWLVAQALVVRTWLPGSAHRRLVLRAFGARIGQGVVIKPGVRVKFPWRLVVGDHAWIGEDVWIDNLATVRIGADCCLSQGAYLCTGNHDWSSPSFDLRVAPITIGDGAWIAAKAVVGPGVDVGAEAVLTLGSTAVSSLEPAGIYAGTPAVRVGTRLIRMLTDRVDHSPDELVCTE